MLGILGQRVGGPAVPANHGGREAHAIPLQPRRATEGVLAQGPQVVDQRERGKTNGGANPLARVEHAVVCLEHLILAGQRLKQDPQERVIHARVGVEDHEGVVLLARLRDPLQEPAERIALPPVFPIRALVDASTARARHRSRGIGAVVSYDEDRVVRRGVVERGQAVKKAIDRGLLVVRRHHHGEARCRARLPPRAMDGPVACWCEDQQIAGHAGQEGCQDPEKPLGCQVHPHSPILIRDGTGSIRHTGPARPGSTPRRQRAGSGETQLPRPG